MSLYEYVNSNPVIYRDPWGLWKIYRSGNLTAYALPEKNDTIRSLAKIIGLEFWDWRKWLTLHSHQICTNRGYLFESQLTFDTVICDTVSVPNIVMAYWGGEFEGLGKHVVDWGIDISTLKQRGFFVFEAEGYMAAQLESVIGGLMWYKELHGILAWGHGSKRGSFLTVASEGDNGSYYSKYVNWRPHYRMAFGAIYACFSQSAMKEFSYKAIFWGSPGVLWPAPFHWYAPSVASLIPPGAQGTKY